MGTLALVPAGAGVWVFRYGGYVRLWLGCQDPLAGLWGIQWLRREVQDQCVCCMCWWRGYEPVTFMNCWNYELLHALLKINLAIYKIKNDY